MLSMILVTGATGTNGRPLVKLLRDRGLPVRALVRDAGKAQDLAADGAELALGDLADAATLERALEGVDRVLLLTPPSTGTLPLSRNFIEVAARTSRPHVMKFSALAVRPESPSRLLRWHAEAERALEQSGLAWTHLRPGFFMTNLLGAAQYVRDNGMLAQPWSAGQLAMVDPRDTVAVAAAILADPGPHAGKRYDITGPEALDGPGYAAVLSEVLGKPVQFADLPAEAFGGMLRGMGTPEELVLGLVELTDEIRTNGYATVDPQATRTIGGITPTSFRQFVQDHAAAFS